MSLANEIELLQRKAGSYDMLKDEYDRLRDSAKEAIEKLSKLIGSTEITLKGAKKRNSSRVIADRLMERFKTEDNFQANKDTIRKEAELLDIEIKPYLCQNVKTVLMKQKGVHETKDGRSWRLFYVKPNEDKENKITIGKVSHMG